jgi:hypothetical protein
MWTRLTCQKGVFTRKSGGIWFQVVSNGDMANLIESQ